MNTKEHDWSECWCPDCIRKLLAANDRYFRAWLRKREREQTSVIAHGGE